MNEVGALELKEIKRFYVGANLGNLLLLALSISCLFLWSYRQAADEHAGQLREEILRSKREFIQDAVNRTIQEIEMERTRCAAGEQERCDEALKERWRERIRAIRLKDNGYLWINVVLNYEGGDDYAYRFVHPNLPESEGMTLSTTMRDVKGNTPYRTELEGVKKDGELFFDYWFKKMDSEVIRHKLTFAKLYKPYDWIVATGVYLDDIDALVQSGASRWDANFHRHVLSALAITGLASVLAWLFSLLVGRRVDTMYAYFLGRISSQKETLRLHQETLEEQVRERTESLASANRELEEEMQARKELEDSLRMRSFALDHVHEAAYLVDEDGYFRYVNEEASRVLGYSRTELLASRVTDIDPDFPAERWPEHWRELKTNRSLTFEGQHRTMDGRTVPVEINANYLEFEGQGFSLALVRDITRRKLLDNALLFVAQRGWRRLAGAESFFEALARFLGESLAMDYAIIDRIDDNPEIAETVAVYAKGAIVPSMRYPLAGTPCANVMGKQLCVYPQGVQQLFPEDTILVEMGVEGYIGIPLWDSLGQPIGLIALLDSKPLADIAAATQVLQLIATRAAAELDRERSDRILRRREYEFRTLTENLPDNIIRYDWEGRVVYVNPALEKNLGIAAAEMIGKRLREYYPDGRFEAYDQTMDAALASGENGELELTMPFPGEEPAVHQIRMIVEHNEQGEVIGLLAIGRDITGRKRAEEALRMLNAELEQRVAERTAELCVAKERAEEANRAKSDFLANVSHEIRTPLNAIIGMAELLKDTPVSDEQREYIKIFEANGEALHGIINDIIDLSKVEAGRIELDCQEFDPVRLVEEVCTLMALKAHEKGLELRHGFGGRLPACLEGDPARLRQILLNLIGNAVKFTAAGEVAVHCTVREAAGLAADETELLFTVSDTGIGIPTVKQQAIFERFIQADSSTTRQFGGTGLGLTISRQLAALMGGALWVESREGHGSTFSCTARVRVTEKTPPTDGQFLLPFSGKREAPLPDLRTVAPQHLLLADDYLHNQIIVQQYLKHTALVVDVAVNGAIAVEMFKTGDYDLVLMDLQMPVMDGFRATREIRAFEQDQGRSPVPVIALSAYAMTEEIHKSREAGCNEHLSKPVKKEQLLSALCRHLRLSPSPVEGAQSTAPLPLSPEPGNSGHRILLRLDKDFADFISGFLHDVAESTNAMLAALSVNGYAFIQATGHQLKGAGGGYGFAGISELAKLIEAAAREKDAAEVGRQLEALENYLEHIEITFE